MAERVDADVCVVGAGYAGLTAARRLAQHGRAVVVLEAWPVYLFLDARLRDGGAVGLVPLAAGLAGAALITLAAVLIPLEVGVRRVERLEL